MRHILTTTVEIEAPPAAVWAELVAFDRYPEWNPFVVEATGTAAVGTTLAVHLQPPGGRSIRLRPVVTVVEPARTLEWFGRLGLPRLFDGRHRFELHPTRTGTRLVHEEVFTGVLVRPLLRSLESSTRAGFVAMNEALRRRVLARDLAA